LNKLTVITVVKNSGDKIKKTIESLRAQIFTDYEHIVHDGGSIDNTVDIIAKYSPMSKITIEKDDSLYEGLNKAIKKASGEYFLLLHAGDILPNNLTLQCLNQSIAKSGSDLFLHSILVESSDKNETQLWDISKINKPFSTHYYLFPHTGMVYKKSLYNNIGDYSVKYGHAGDLEWILRLSRIKNLKITKINDPLVTMEIGGLSTNKISRIIRNPLYDYKIFKKYYKYPLILVIKKRILKMGLKIL
jgi:glycosyltransferase involved in cell wall biosynthesis